MTTPVYDRPGLYFTETLSDPPLSADINLSNAVFVGPTSRGPVGVKTVTTYPQFQKYFGQFSQGRTPSPLEYAVWQYFNNGGRNAQIARVLHGDEVTASAILVDREVAGQPTNNISNPNALIADDGGLPPIGPPVTNTSSKPKSVGKTLGASDPGPAGELGPEGGGGGQTDGTGVGGTSAGPSPCLILTATNPGAWANQVYYAVSDSVPYGQTTPATRFNLAIYYQSLLQPVERFTDLSMDPTDLRYVLNIVNAADPRGSVFVTASIPTGFTFPASPTLTQQQTLIPASVVASAATALGAGTGGVAGVDSTLPYTAFLLDDYENTYDAIDGVQNPLGMNLPGVVDNDILNSALAYCANRGDAFAVIDTTVEGDADATDCVTSISTLVGPDGGPTSYGAAYFPPVVFADPASRAQGARVILPVGGAVLGLYAQTDATLGVQQTAAGNGASINGAIGLATSLSSADLALLNQNGVCAVRNIPGSGVVLFGARTIKGGSDADKYISVRRTLIYVKAQLASIMNPFLFKGNTPLLQQNVESDVNAFLTAFQTAQGITAFYAVCDDTNNTEVTIDNGELHLDVGIAPLRPSEFIAINVTQFDGATTVTDAA